MSLLIRGLLAGAVLSLPFSALAGDPPAGTMAVFKLDLSKVCTKGNDPLCAPPPAPPSRQQALANLIQAAGQGDLRAIQEALAAGAPVDSRNAAGDTALAAAVIKKQAEAVRVLLAAHANPNVPTSSGQETVRPLCFAGFSGQQGIADALLAAGAAPSANSSLSDGKEIVQLTPAACAAVGGNVGTLNAILQKGGSPDADKAVKNGRPPLFYGVDKNHPDIIAALCSKKANPNVTVRGNSLLRESLQAKRYGAAQALLQCKANPNWRDANGVSELRYLVRGSDLEGIFLLNRFKPNFKDQLDGVSILEETVANGEPKIKAMRALLAGGASPQDEKLLGKMIEQWLTRSGTMDQSSGIETMQLMSMLLAKGASTSEQVNGNSLVAFVLDNHPEFYAQNGLFDFYADLLKTDNGIGSPSARGQLPVVQSYLHLRNNPEKLTRVLDIFIAKKVDINAPQPSDGRNLLDTAAWNSDMQNRKTLQERGACRAGRRLDNEWRYCG
jgi:ankyrin repeat protein